MHDCDYTPARRGWIFHLSLAVTSALVLLSGSFTDAGQGSGRPRGAMSFAWQLEGKATFVVEPTPRGHSVWPGESFVDRPSRYAS